VDDGGVLSEPAAILRRIDPGSAPGLDLGGQGKVRNSGGDSGSAVGQGAEFDLEGAWSKAVASIVEARNAEVVGEGERGQSVGEMQRWALALLADPSVRLPPGGDNAYEALRVGRNQPVRRALGQIKRQAERHEITRNEAALRIAEVVRGFGLRAVEPPAPRSPVTEDDVSVVCWMAVCSASARRA